MNLKTYMRGIPLDAFLELNDLPSKSINKVKWPTRLKTMGFRGKPCPVVGRPCYDSISLDHPNG